LVKINTMKKLRWQFVIILLTGLVVGILLISQQPAAVISSGGQPQVQPTAAPATGGLYTEALVGSFMRLNPLLDVYNPADRDVDRLLYSHLINFDATGNPQPDLAESWGISKDGTLFNISLRSDAKWHDGKPVTAADVVFTIDLLRSDASLTPDDVKAFWQEVEVKKLSDTQIQFLLPEAYAPFLERLNFGILPEHLLSGVTFDQLIDDPFNLSPVGSGPYQLERLLVEDARITGVVLKINPSYYKAKPFIDQIVFRYYESAEDAWEAYKAGEVQGFGEVSDSILDKVLADKGLATHTGLRPQLSLIYLNLNNAEVPFFQDAVLRQAMMMSLNRQRMVDTALNGQGVLANGPILPGSWAYSRKVKPVSFDRQAAKDLLEEAGYKLDPEQGLTTKEGLPVDFELLYPDDLVHEALAGAIQKDLLALGITVTITPRSYETLISESLTQRAYQAALVEINLSNAPDPDPYPLWDASQATDGQNYAQWNNRDASTYLEQARITVDPGERIRLYHNFQVVFAKELPALPLYYPVYTYAITRDVQGVTMGALFDRSERFLNVANWYLVAKHTASATATSKP